MADWWARRFVDRHVGKRVIEGMPLPQWGATEIAKAAELAAELSRRGGITTLGGLGPIPAPGSDLSHLSRFEVLADIDGLVLAGFGLTAADLDVILDDFTETPDAVPSDYRSKLRKV